MTAERDFIEGYTIITLSENVNVMWGEKFL